jgi:dihydrofolate reductase (trimethoprim resistance protein)
MRLTLLWTRDTRGNILYAPTPFGRVGVIESEGVYYPTWDGLVDWGRPCSSEGNAKFMIEVDVTSMLEDVTSKSGFTLVKRFCDGPSMLYARGSKKIEMFITEIEGVLVYKLIIRSEQVTEVVDLTERNSLEDALAKYCPRDGVLSEPLIPAMGIGSYVRKKSGSEWEGVIVGSYSTELTHRGWCVESSSHKGSVQIYPDSALEIVK